MDQDPDKSDYENWDFLNGTCQFGKRVCFVLILAYAGQTRYLRRKPDRDCSPRQLYSSPVVDITPCECTRSDFECDYNYILDSEGNCVLGPNLLASNPVCIDGVKRFSVGYVKKRLSQCSGGLEEQFGGKTESCGK